MIKSFRYAINGVLLLIRNERNAKLHTVATIAVVILGIVLNINSNEWIAIFISIGFVFSMEAMNTAIEHIANFIQPKQDYKIKVIKDIAAGGVLFSAIVAFVVGLLIFIPKLTAP